ncbi:hypothetical protein ACLB2K_052288 [Fragaria x ananassa]
MAARRGGGKHENHMKDEESRGEELHALRRHVKKLALLIERLEARRKHGGSRSGNPYHETKTEIRSNHRGRPSQRSKKHGGSRSGNPYHETKTEIRSNHRGHPSQRSKNHLWKVGSPRFQEWLEVARDICTKECKIEHEDNIEVDWNSPPIYDEYLDVESFDPTKETIGESLHDNNFGDTCLNGDQEFKFSKEVLACSDELLAPSDLDDKVLFNEQGKSHGAFLVCEIGDRTPTKAVTKTPFELWKGRKPSVMHAHVWGCRAEARAYNPKVSKLDSKTISAFFIGYPENSRGFKFYCPSHTSRTIETNKAVFLNEMTFTYKFDDFVLEELAETDLCDVDMHVVSEPTVTIHIPSTENYADAIVPNQNEFPVVQNTIAQEMPNLVVENVAGNVVAPPQPVLRRSQRERKSALANLVVDYQIYLQDIEFDVGELDDPTTFKEAIESSNSQKWEEAMVSELKSMKANDVWKLVQLPKNAKTIGCKWVYKTKTNADGSIERFKAKLVAKGFTQQEWIDYNETYSPVSTKDAFRLIMALVAHFNMELHQMDVRTAFFEW